MKSIRRLRSLIVGATLVGLAGVVPAQLAVNGGGSPAAAEVSYDGCGVVLSKSDGSPWACSFVDNFDGTSLNTTKWGVQQTAVTGFRTGQTCYTASDRNIRVRRGALELTAARLRGNFTCKSPSGDFVTTYTGGMVGTRGRFSQTYGRFEVRAKWPSTQTAGLHGAFWMYPLNHTYGPWPHSGEIDVAEWWSNASTYALPTLHYAGRDYWADSGWGCRVATPSAYHTYAVEWLPTQMRFFIDGALCFARTWTPASPLVAPQPFDHPFSMILNMGVGPASGHNAVTSSTQLPATFTVDYAKAWR